MLSPQSPPPRAKPIPRVSSIFNNKQQINSQTSDITFFFSPLFLHPPSSFLLPASSCVLLLRPPTGSSTGSPTFWQFIQFISDTILHMSNRKKGKKKPGSKGTPLRPPLVTASKGETLQSPLPPPPPPNWDIQLGRRGDEGEGNPYLYILLGE